MKKIRNLLTVITMMVMLVGTMVYASEGEYGAVGAGHNDTYTLEEMLQYALEDEVLAQAEYAVIIEELGAGRPFTNIIKAEETHIELVKRLYAAQGMEVPTVDASTHVVIPESIEEALKAGVVAEINNIGMYEKFLEQDLPEDVRLAFESLKSASESHLKAFEGNNSGSGQGNRGIKGQKGSGVSNGTDEQKGNGMNNGTGGQKGNRQYSRSGENQSEQSLRRGQNSTGDQLNKNKKEECIFE